MIPLTLVLILYLVGCDAFKDGAPSFICTAQKQRPYHQMYLPERSAPPYQIVVSSSIYKPSVPINVTLHGNGVPFKGFFLTADTTSQAFNGLVANLTSDVKPVPNCGMTHTDNLPKTAITLTWTPPPLVHLGNLQFVTIVVANLSTCWIDIRSDVMKPDLALYPSYKDVLQQMRSQSQVTGQKSQSKISGAQTNRAPGRVLTQTRNSRILGMSGIQSPP